MIDIDIDEVANLAERIRPLLAGHSPQVQGAVLADLSAIWLTGHMVPGDVEATQSVRAELLAYQCQTIRALVIAGEMEYGWSDPRRN